MAAPSRITSYTQPRGSSLTLPPSVVADDLIVIDYTRDGGESSETPPTGWVQIDRYYGGGDGQTVRSIYKIADGSESSQTLSPGFGSCTWVVFHYRGVDLTTPIGAVSKDGNHKASADISPATETLTIAAVTSAVADSVVHAVFAADVWDDYAGYTFTTPSGFGNKTQNHDLYDNVCAFDKTLSGAVSSGTVSTTMNTEGILGLVFIINGASGGGGGDITLLPDLLTQNKTIYAPTVTPGEITVNPGLLTQTKTIFAPVIAVGAITLLAPLLTHTHTIYSPTVSTGEINISAPLLTQSKTIFSPTVSAGAITLAAPLLSQTKTIYAPLLTQAGGAQTLLPPLLTQTKTIYAPTMTFPPITLALPLLTRVKTIYAPKVDSGGRWVTIENRVSNATDGRTTSTGGVEWFTHTQHIIAGGDVKDLFPILDGWYKGAGSVESNLANPYNIIKMTFYITGETPVPVTFGGSRTYTISPGAENVEGDVVSPSAMKAILTALPIGTEFWCKVQGTMNGVAANQVLPTNTRVSSDVSGTQYGWYNSANTTIVNDADVAGPFTWTGTTPQLRTSGWCPQIGGHFVDGQTPVVLIFDGDSHTQGLQDAVASKYGRGVPQYVLKGDGSNSPITGLRSGGNMGVSGDSSSSRLSSPKLIGKARYATDVYTHIGSNDLSLNGSGNVTTIHTNRLQMLNLLKNAVTAWSTRTPKTMMIEFQPAAGVTNPTKTLNSAPNTNWGVGEKSWQLTQVALADVGVTFDYFAMTPSYRQSTDSTQVEYFLWKYNPAATVNVYDTLMTPDGQHAGNAGVLLWAADINPVYRQIGVDASLTAPLLTQSKVIYSPTVSQGDLAIQLPLLTQTKTIYAPTVSTDALTITLPLLIQTKTIFEPALVNDITISVPLLNHGSTVFAPSVSQVIDVPLITQSKVIYPPVLSQGAVIIVPPVLIQTKVIFEPEVTFGAITISAPLLTNTKSIFVPTVDVGGLNLLLPLIERTKVVFEPSISAGSITIEPGLLIVDKTVFSPSVSVDQTIDVPLLTRDKVIYPFTLTQYEAGLIVIELPLLTRTKVIYTPGLAAGVLPVVTVVSNGAVTTEIVGHTIADNISVKTTVSSLGTIVQGNELLNTSVAGMLTVMPDNLP